MKKRILALLIISFIVVFILLTAFLFFIFIGYGQEKAEINENAVLEVIDGDTFKLWSGEIVRLICVDAPEKGKKGYEEARDFLSFLVLNKEVRLERDVSDKDGYGRLLRYVYVSGDNEEIFVNKEIVLQGYGDVFRYGNDTERCGEIGGELERKFPLVETSRFAFAQSPYFSSRASKSNLDGAQEPEHAPDFSPRVLDK